MSATGLLYRSLQSPTSVTAACCISTAEGQVVLQLQDTRLTYWRAGTDGLEQTASWRGPASMLQMVHLPGNYLLILAEGGRCYLHAWQEACGGVGAAAPPLLAQEQLQVPVDSSASQVQPYGCVMSTNVLSSAVAGGTASLAAVAYLPGVLHVIKAAPPVAHSTQGTNSSAAAGAPDGAMQLQTKAMALMHVLLSCHYPGGEPPALASVRVASHVLAMAWLSAEEQQLDLQGRSLLAVLHEITVGSQPPVLHVDCVAVDWVQGTISQGPWSLRNVHPTTRLLQPFPGSDRLPPGILVISSRDVLLCTCLGSSLQQQQHQQSNSQQRSSSSHAAAQAHAAPAAISGMQETTGSKLLGVGFCAQQLQVAQWALPGLPMSCTALPGSSLIVGDSRAGLHLLQMLGDSSSSIPAPVVQLRLSGCLAIPDLLLRVPLENPQHQQQLSNTETQQLSGLLFVGSKCSSSQTVGLPQSLSQAVGSRQLVLEQQQQQEQAMVLPILQSALQPSLAGAQAVAVHQDPSGALPEQQLLVACGVAPRGKLAAVRSGCGLLPAMLDGPELPGDAQLFAIPQPQPCNHKQQQHQPQQRPAQHSMLGFSFPSAGASSVMSLEGETFRQLQPSGLDHADASLLLTTAPGGWMVQVTAAGVRVLDASADWQLCSQWNTTPGSSVSLAAACGSRLVVACGAQLTCLAVSCCSGSLEVVAAAELQQQASALSIFTLQGGQLVVAAGLWVDNTVLLMTLPAQATGSAAATAKPIQLQKLCTVELHEEQPRSIALLPVGTADVLLVGGNTGKVLLWEVCVREQQQQQGSISVSLQHPRAVQTSNTSVSLQQSWLPAVGGKSSDSDFGSRTEEQRAAAPCVVAHAGAMVVFRANAALLDAVQLQPSSSSAGAAAASGLSGDGGFSATACVEVSRLCGSEACLGAAPVHTPAMPHSLAWVSAAHRLCFGSIAPEHKLRWRSCGLAGTPLAMAVHQASDTIIVLLAADEFEAGSGSGSRGLGQQQYAQQRLGVLDAKSLRVLMQLALAPGHTYTMLHVLDFPATSQQQQQGNAAQASGMGGAVRGSSSAGGGAGAAAASVDGGAASVDGQGQLGCLPFIVLGSHAVLAAAVAIPASSRNAPAAGSAAAPMVKRVGLLSVFELRRTVVQAQAVPQSTPQSAGQQQDGNQRTAAGSELRYELVLHGMVPLQVTPCSACTVVPQLLQPMQQQLGSQGAAAGHPKWLPVPAAAAQQQPLLVVGSERGLTLLRVVVDDAAAADKHTMEGLLRQVGQVPQGSGASSVAAAQQQQPQGPAASAQDIMQEKWQRAHARRSGRVSVQELSSATPLFQGVVTKLSSCGSCVVALESMGPVAAFQALCVQPGGWVQLLGVGMDDRSKLMAVDFIQAAPQQQGPSIAIAASRTGAGAGAVGVAAGTAAVSSADGSSAEQGPQHAAVLVAAHPAGLMLLQQDLQQEASHVDGMLQAAQAAWEAGQRPPDFGGQHRGILLVEPAAANSPWQGAGQAAPWAGGGLDGGAARAAALDQQGALDDERAAVLLLQQQLAAAAEAAAGVAHTAEHQCVRPDWLNLMNPTPGLAPVMLPSAACAPAPGSMLLCQACLGLHTAPAQTAPGSSSGEATSGQAGSGELSTQMLDQEGPVGDSVLCLSSSGGVAAAQLLPASQMSQLLPWQASAVLEPQAAGQLLLWGLGAPGSAAAAASLVGAGLAGSGAFVAKEFLRGLPEPDPVSSYEGYERAPGALASAQVGRLVLQEQRQDEDTGRQGAPLGVVDGDLLDMVAARQQGHGGGGMQAAVALQHSLWQQAL